MQTVRRTSPYIRKEISTKRMMTDVIIALLPVTVFAIYRFGTDALFRIVVSILTMVILEAIAFGLMQKPKKADTWLLKTKSRYEKYNATHLIIPAVSGLIFALIIPSQLPYYGVIIGAAFGIIVAKMMFGGTGNNIFNVAGAGRVFIGLALTSLFTNTYSATDIVAGGTALTALKGNLGFPYVLDSYSLSEAFFGYIPGSMGEVSAFFILIGLAYLLIRKSADWRVVAATLIPFMIFAYVAGLAIDPSRALDYMVFHVVTGGLLFGVAFMVTDPVTSPVTAPGRVYYGILIASLVIIIRLFGAYPEGMVFAIIFANMFVPLIDFPQWSKSTFSKTTWISFIIIILLVSSVVFFGLGGQLS